MFNFNSGPSFTAKMRKAKNWRSTNNWNSDLFGLGVKPSTTSDYLPWSEGVWFWYRKNDLTKIRVRDGYEAVWPWKTYSLSRQAQKAIPRGPPSKALLAPIPIPYALKADLLQMLNDETIPAKYTSEVFNFPHESWNGKPGDYRSIMDNFGKRKPQVEYDSDFEPR